MDRITDPDDPTVIDWPARQAAALFPFRVRNGMPITPNYRTGRTGLMHRGGWGENRTADAAVIADRRLLLIRRGDTGLWALPGGFLHPGEDPRTGALRELAEETGIRLPASAGTVLGYRKVDDPRCTDNAWIVTTVTVIGLPNCTPPTPGDDATEAAWWPLSTAVDMNQQIAVASGFGLAVPHWPLIDTVHNRCGGAR